MQVFKVIAVSLLIAGLYTLLSCIHKNTDTTAVVNQHKVNASEISHAKPKTENDQHSIPHTKPTDSSTDQHNYHSDHIKLNELFAKGDSYANKKEVVHYIKFFQTKYKKYFVKWLERSKYYTPNIREMLAKEGLPETLAYLPLIESGFNPDAVSHKHAVGLWQFIKSTGKIYDLNTSYWVDERRDYEKSTIAASRYLQKLHKEFNSWELAIAAYNCGKRRIRKGIRKTRSHNFWTVSKTLPRETRNYVPKFIASLIILADPEKYGFEKPIYNGRDQLVKVTVPPQRKLKDIAKVADYSHKKIIYHNPFLTRKITPPGKSSYIYVEQEHEKNFVNNKQKIAELKKADIRRSTYSVYRVKNGDSLWKIARRFDVKVSSIKKTNKLKSDLLRPGQKLTIARSLQPYYGSEPYVHIVRRGDNLWKIARRFDVRVSSIKKANQLRSNLLKPGQKLIIEKSLQKQETPHDPPTQHNSNIHIVREGDNLWDIARRFDVRVSSIKKANQLRSNLLKPGQKLIIEKSPQKQETPHDPPTQHNSNIHIVREGDNLWDIARRFDVRVSSIKKANQLRSNLLKPGQKLIIEKSPQKPSPSHKPPTPQDDLVYIVKKGDTISEIAHEHGIRTSSLKNYNGLNSSHIKAKQRLKIPKQGKTSFNHNIKYGDTLSEIAVKYKVSVNDIKEWNNLRTSKLNAGQELKIYQ